MFFFVHLQLSSSDAAIAEILAAASRVAPAELLEGRDRLRPAHFLLGRVAAADDGAVGIVTE